MALKPRVCDVAEALILIFMLRPLSMAGASPNATCTHEPRITGLIDGDTPGTDRLPKVVQLYFPCPAGQTDDEYAVVLLDNTGAEKVRVPLQHLTRDGFAYVSPESEVFRQYMGFSPDYTSAAFYPTGTSSIALMRGDQFVDVYGDPQNATEHPKFDFSQGTAARIFGSHPDGAGILGDWIIHKGKARNSNSVMEAGANFVMFQSCSTYPCRNGQYKIDTADNCTLRFCDCAHCCLAEACTAAANRTMAPEENETTAHLGSCSEFECPAGFGIRDDPESLKCSGPVCEKNPDLNTCCSQVTAATPDPVQDTTTMSANSTGHPEGSMPASVSAARDEQNITFKSALSKVSGLFAGPVLGALSQFILGCFLLCGSAALSVAVWRRRSAAAVVAEAAAAQEDENLIAVDGDHDQPMSYSRSLVRRP